MKKITTINLNGRAYQVEEEAHGALSQYLEKATLALSNNPDKDEILADFETAIAEKCSRYLSPSKNVVSHSEIETIIKEMGPVGSGSESEQKNETGGGTTQNAASDPSKPKRLYRIREGKVIAGVCNGLAAYFNIDVVLVRVLFVVLIVISQGAGILLYLIMMMIIPRADTVEKMAQAQGVPFTAHDLIEQAKKNYAEYRGEGKNEWKAHMREQKKYWKYKAKQAMHESRRAERREHSWTDTLAGMLWFAGLIFFCVLLYRHVPFFHYNLDKLGHFLTTEMNQVWR